MQISLQNLYMILVANDFSEKQIRLDTITFKNYLI